jgi:hypothetical protein
MESFPSSIKRDLHLSYNESDCWYHIEKIERDSVAVRLLDGLLVHFESQYIIEIIPPIIATTKGASTGESETSSLELSFELNPDRSINLESIKGVEIKALMLLNSWELKKIGLKREYDEVAGKVKFFAINPQQTIEAITSLPIEKSLPDEVSSDAIVVSKTKLTYKFAPNGSLVLRSIRGMRVDDFKRLTDDELRALGLYRDESNLHPKYFEIQDDRREGKPKQAKEISPDTAAPSIQKSLPDETLSNAIAATDVNEPLPITDAISTNKILTRPEALAIAQNFGFLGTAQNLYDWAKASLTSKSDESKRSNREKLASVGLVPAKSDDGKIAWVKL